jgi:hypothetical protein
LQQNVALPIQILSGMVLGLLADLITCQERWADSLKVKMERDLTLKTNSENIYIEISDPWSPLIGSWGEIHGIWVTWFLPLRGLKLQRIAVALHKW